MRLAMSNSLAKTFHPSTLSHSLGSCSNRFSVLTNLFKNHLKSLVPCHFTLEKSEVFRVPSGCRDIHVVSGIAWITVAGKDMILRPGEKASLSSNQDSAVISPLGNVPLTLEVL